MERLSTLLENAEETVPQTFRDAFAYHLYMLYSLMFILESSQQDFEALRATCANTMLLAATTMANYRSILWQRGVPDEAVVNLPCRIAYCLLEKAKGVVARRTVCGDQALQMLAVTVDAHDCLLTAVAAALMDLMHSHEHMAALTAELVVQKMKDERLGTELLREMGRLDGSGGGGNNAKASCIKFVAPLVSEVANRNPKLVLQNLSHLLPLLENEPYNLRSAIVTAMAHILEYLGKHNETVEDGHVDTTKTRDNLLDLLTERVYDVSSFTRAAVLKAWISLVQTRSLPKERVLSVTKLAMDRLQDKTVMGRKQAMQVCIELNGMASFVFCFVIIFVF